MYDSLCSAGTRRNSQSNRPLSISTHPVVIGAGQAGAQAVDTLRREGFDGRLVLIGDEPRAARTSGRRSSKKYLSGDMAAERLLFRHRAFYEDHRVDLKLGMPAVRLDAAARQVELADGEKLNYDRLLLCLGARSRRLTCPGAALAGRALSTRPCGRGAHSGGPQAAVLASSSSAGAISDSRRRPLAVAWPARSRCWKWRTAIMNRVVAPSGFAVFRRGASRAGRRHRVRHAGRSPRRPGSGRRESFALTAAATRRTWSWSASGPSPRLQLAGARPD